MNRRELLAATTAVTIGRLLRTKNVLDATDLSAADALRMSHAESAARPTPRQLAWHRTELTMFVHFTVNTFSDKEWGDGTESPVIFHPGKLDARQWARAAKAGGFRRMILTAKHHDGFCLWQTDTTDHSVRSSRWRDGKGDVVRDFVDACRTEGLGVGIYLSPWDRHERSYGDSPRYNDFYNRQLTELLTHYGSITEVWFDGANGEGPNGKRQVYDWPRTYETVRRLQPDAVMFSDLGPDVRWIGNENGTAPETNWCTVDPAATPTLGQTTPAVIRALQQGDPLGSVWRPGEADVSIRPGWFWHADQDDQIRTLDNLVGLYFSTVGRNAGFLLNIPPTREGLFHQTDGARLAEFGSRIRSLFATNIAAGMPAQTSSVRDAAHRGARVADDDPETYWMPAREVAPSTPAWIEVTLPRPAQVDVIALQEPIAEGQHVAYYRVLGHGANGWSTLTWGTTIGYKKLDRINRAMVDRVRLEILASFGTPRISTFGMYAGDV